MTPEQQKKFINGLSTEHINMLLYDWALWARDSQWPPDGDWNTWIIMAGRGFGKTRAGAEWIRKNANLKKPKRIAIVGETFQDVRQVMVEGASGLISIAPPEEKPQWLPSRRLLIWPNGSIGHCYSAAEPDQLRGPEHEIAWCDEIAKWNDEDAWNNLMLGLRLGRKPQVIATTTPQPKAWLINLIKEPGVILTRGKTAENKANLAPSFLKAVEARFKNSPLGAQELEGLLMQDLPDALWQRSQIEASRGISPERQNLTDVIIGVDPAVGGNDETGIIVTAKDNNGMLWVLEDLSLKAPPHRWAEVIASTATKWNAAKIVVEVNQGGALVQDVLQTKGVRWPIEAVRAKQGKIARAEPIAAAYAEGHIKHAARFEKLEDQMCQAIPGQKHAKSPDRLDALVWALTTLMRQKKRSARSLNF